MSILILLVVLLFAALLAAFAVRSAWGFGLPGLLMLILILYLLFIAG